MDSLVVVIVLVTIILLVSLGIVLFRRKKELSTENSGIQITTGSSISPKRASIEEVPDPSFQIQVQKLNDLNELDQTKLHEIADTSVLARLSATIPLATNLCSAVSGIKNVENINAVSDSLKGMTDMFKVIIPRGQQLTKSTTILPGDEQAYRAFTTSGGKITGHANLVKMEAPQVDQVSNIANLGAVAMNLASFVVGQYYMSEINSKLEKMSADISKIADFQQKEFKSRILALIASVGKISKFSIDIVENDEVRERKLTALDRLEEETVRLLQQVNLSIDEITKSNEDVNYEAYQEKANELALLSNYQEMLMMTLEEISKLNYLLERGRVTPEMSYELYRKYEQQSSQTREKLVQWQSAKINHFQIDLENHRRSKKGIESVISKPMTLIDERWHYHEIDLEFNGVLSRLQDRPESDIKQLDDVYDNDVSVVIRDGKYFYLEE